MKSLLLSVVLLAEAFSAHAQIATNIQIRCLVKLDDGTSSTNTTTFVNTNIVASLTNAMINLNLVRASEDPPHVAFTNLSEFVMEASRRQVLQYSKDWDFKISQDYSIKLPNISDADKAQIRAILNKY
jgi:hypothetical protein